MINNFSICSKLVTLKSILAGLVVLVVLGFFFTACSSSKPEDMLIGKWKAINKETSWQSLEFLKDGTFLMGSSSWRYRVFENGLLEVDTTQFVAGKVLFELSVAKDELVLTWKGGETVKYRRVD
jgi:ABC-type glycerol-3-phosphate transport system permease component